MEAPKRIAAAVAALVILAALIVTQGATLNRAVDALTSPGALLLAGLAAVAALVVYVSRGGRR